MHIEIRTTAEQVANVSMTENKVYVFVEPTIIICVLFGCKPDEHDGKHCCSFVLKDEEALHNSLALTDFAIEAHTNGTDA